MISNIFKELCSHYHNPITDDFYHLVLLEGTAYIFKVVFKIYSPVLLKSWWHTVAEYIRFKLVNVDGVTKKLV